MRCPRCQGSNVINLEPNYHQCGDCNVKWGSWATPERHIKLIGDSSTGDPEPKLILITLILIMVLMLSLAYCAKEVIHDDTKVVIGSREK